MASATTSNQSRTQIPLHARETLRVRIASLLGLILVLGIIVTALMVDSEARSQVDLSLLAWAALGIVASLARPGGNVTALTNVAPELMGKRLELMREVVANLSRIAVTWPIRNKAARRYEQPLLVNGGHPIFGSKIDDQLTAAERRARQFGSL